MNKDLTSNSKINYFSEKINPSLGWNSEDEPLFIASYCLFSDLLKSENIKNDIRAKFEIIDVLMVVFIAFESHGFNFKKALNSYYFLSKKFISYSRLIRLIHIHKDKINLVSSLFQKQMFSEQEKKELSEFRVDSFPVEIGKVYRGKNLKMYDMNLHGYCASKKKYFIGFKITTITDLLDNIIVFSINYGKDYDSNILKQMLLELENSGHYFLAKKDLNFIEKYKIIYADKGYWLALEMQEILKFYYGLIIKAQTKKNMKLYDKKENNFISKKRFPIERLFSKLLSKFYGKIHATTINGFLLKINILFFGYSTKKQILDNKF